MADFNALLQGPSVVGAPTGGVLTPPPGGLAARVLEAEKEQAGLRAGAIAETGTDPGNLGPPGMEDLGLRADLGLSDTVEEKRLKFKEKFPEGDFIKVQTPTGGTELLFRKNQNEPFAKVDAGAFEKFEVLGDMADITGDLPAAAVEALITKGGGLLKQMGKVFAGSVVGDEAKEAIEEFRGFQKEMLVEQQARILARGALGAAGAGATAAISGPINALRGRASVKLAPGAPAAQKAAAEEGIPSFTPGQIAQSPILRRLQGQAGATVSSVKDYVQGQQRASVEALARLRNADQSRLLKGNLEQVHNDARKQVIQAARVSDKKLSDGGKAIQEGIAEYDDLARASVGKAYADARKIDTPEFEPSPAREVGQEIQLRADELGQPPLPAVTDAIKRLDEFDPNAPPVELPSGAIIDNTERLRAIRQDLYDAKTPAVGEPMRRPQVQAAKLYGAIDHVLKNPNNADPRFTEAWAKANAEAAKRFDTLEKLVVIRAQRDETPAILAKRLGQPLQVDNINVLKEVIPEKKFKEFKDSVKADFLAENNVDSLTKRMDSFDKETLDALFDQGEQGALKDIGQSLDNINSIDIPGALDRQAKAGAVLDELISTRKTGDIARLREIIPKGSAQETTVRAAIMERVFKNVIDSKEGGNFVDSKKLRSEIKKLVDSGSIKFLNRGDIRTIRNIDKVAEFIPEAIDSGTSIQAGETAQALRGLQLSGGITFLENLTTARIMTSPLVQKILLGQGGKPLDFSKLRVLGAIAAQTSADVTGDEGKEQ